MSEKLRSYQCHFLYQDNWAQVSWVNRLPVGAQLAQTHATVVFCYSHERINLLFVDGNKTHLLYDSLIELFIERATSQLLRRNEVSE